MKHRDIRKHLIELLGEKCEKCGSKTKLELDHINPLFKGGGDISKNIQLLCRNCHIEKSRQDKKKIIKVINTKRVFNFEGIEVIEKTVPIGKSNSPRIFVPKQWEGKKVAIVRLE